MLSGVLLDSFGRPTAFRARATAAAANERGEAGDDDSVVAVAAAAAVAADVAEDEDEGCTDTGATAARSSVACSSAPKEGGFDAGVLGVQLLSSLP
mmetsp:Transcript_18104/g.34826  ORF Transcript_18104/g.34826 Transcript_18104/m.34826 type:complete len:96 (+) Transcript_18104:68-355(+)